MCFVAANQFLNHIIQIITFTGPIFRRNTHNALELKMEANGGCIGEWNVGAHVGLMSGPIVAANGVESGILEG